MWKNLHLYRKMCAGSIACGNDIPLMRGRLSFLLMFPNSTNHDSAIWCHEVADVVFNPYIVFVDYIKQQAEGRALHTAQWAWHGSTAQRSCCTVLFRRKIRPFKRSDVQTEGVCWCWGPPRLPDPRFLTSVTRSHRTPIHLIFEKKHRKKIQYPPVITERTVRSVASSKLRTYSIFNITILRCWKANFILSIECHNLLSHISSFTVPAFTCPPERATYDSMCCS